MITHLYRSKSDIENLSQFRTETLLLPDKPTDYRGFVVNKPWGYEYLLYENKFVAIWILYLKSEAKTSMHTHPNKKTSLIVLDGSVLCSSLEGWHNKNIGEAVIIDPGVFHSTKAANLKDGVMIMEIESPPNKNDLVRLNDEYGRHQGYEGTAHFSKNLHDYEYTDFHIEKSFVKPAIRTLRKVQFSMHNHPKNQNLIPVINNSNAHLFCMLSGNLENQLGDTLLPLGEVVHKSTLQNYKKISPLYDIMYLTISYL